LMCILSAWESFRFGTIQVGARVMAIEEEESNFQNPTGELTLFLSWRPSRAHPLGVNVKRPGILASSAWRGCVPFRELATPVSQAMRPPTNIHAR
jgi:hypothetical protein